MFLWCDKISNSWRYDCVTQDSKFGETKLDSLLLLWTHSVLTISAIHYLVLELCVRLAFKVIMAKEWYGMFMYNKLLWLCNLILVANIVLVYRMSGTEVTALLKLYHLIVAKTTWGNWISENLSNMPKIVWLVRGRSRPRNQDSLTAKCVLCEFSAVQFTKWEDD